MIKWWSTCHYYLTDAEIEVAKLLFVTLKLAVIDPEKLARVEVTLILLETLMAHHQWIYTPHALSVR
jgi:hypothetical protein